MADDLIHTPLGEPGSGRVRYGAAMGLHAQGLLSDAALEVYRIAAAQDQLDPVTLLALWGAADTADDLPASTLLA